MMEEVVGVVRFRKFPFSKPETIIRGGNVLGSLNESLLKQGQNKLCMLSEAFISTAPLRTPLSAKKAERVVSLSQVDWRGSCCCTLATVSQVKPEDPLTGS